MYVARETSAFSTNYVFRVSKRQERISRFKHAAVPVPPCDYSQYYAPPDYHNEFANTIQNQTASAMLGVKKIHVKHAKTLTVETIILPRSSVEVAGAADRSPSSCAPSLFSD